MTSSKLLILQIFRYALSFVQVSSQIEIKRASQSKYTFSPRFKEKSMTQEQSKACACVSRNEIPCWPCGLPNFHPHKNTLANAFGEIIYHGLQLASVSWPRSPLKEPITFVRILTWGRALLCFLQCQHLRTM